MPRLEYKILGYAASEFSMTCENFIVVTRLEEAVGTCLRAYVLRGWQQLVPDMSDDTLDYLEAVLFDFRRHLLVEQSYEVDAFLHSVSELSIGPLRTSESGSCDSHELETSNLHPANALGEIIYLNTEEFQSLLSALSSACVQQHAARS